MHPLVPFCDTQNSLNFLNSARQCLRPPALGHLAPYKSGVTKADLREFKAPISYYNLLIDVSLVWLDSTQNHYIITILSNFVLIALDLEIATHDQCHCVISLPCCSMSTALCRCYGALDTPAVVDGIGHLTQQFMLLQEIIL